MENHPESMLRNNNCTHSFCTDCIAKYIAAKIQEYITMLKCPDLDCKGILETEFCRPFVPQQQVFDRWENALCESFVLGSQRFLLSLQGLSAMLVDDGGEVATVSERPSCHRLFFAQCKVSRHAGIECREFQGLKKDERERERERRYDDEAFAKNKKWRRCPNCKFYVAKGRWLFTYCLQMRISILLPMRISNSCVSTNLRTKEYRWRKCIFTRDSVHCHPDSNLANVHV